MTIPIQTADESLHTGRYDVPAWIEREINKAGGMAGDKPLFRATWGGNRLTFGPDGVTLVHPYQQNRWHLEKWHEGEYEHCYVLAHCPHTKGKIWCNECFKNGGEYIGICEGWQVFIAAIHLIQKSQRLQDATLRKNALFEREASRETAKEDSINALFKDAAPKTVKRSFETPLRLTADQALGRRRGLRRMREHEIPANKSR